jgi:hypothetical protein
MSQEWGTQKNLEENKFMVQNLNGTVPISLIAFKVPLGTHFLTTPGKLSLNLELVKHTQCIAVSILNKRERNIYFYAH